MLNRFFIAVTISTLFFVSATTIKAEQTKEDIAIQQAQAWLSVVDGEGYGDSWEQAANLFKNAVQKDQWISSMNAHRKPLGKMLERTMKSKQYRTELPGAPDGEYVVIQYDTVFENKKVTIETITPMLDDDGTWRISGYFIK